MRFLELLKCEIKRAVKLLPRLFTGAILLSVLIGMIAFLGSSLLYKDQVVGKVSVAVVIEAEDEASRLMINTLENMESVKKTCNFIETTKEEAYQMLYDGRIYGIVLVPQGFVGSIMDGTNTPATVVLPNGSGLEAGIVRELTTAGATSLSAAQAGIYAISDYSRKHDKNEVFSEIEKQINLVYMDYVLPRDGYFDEITASATGDLPVMQYYGAMGAVFFLLLCGIGLSHLFYGEKTAFQLKLHCYGLGNLALTVCRTAGVFIAYFVLTVIFLGIAMVLNSVFQLDVLTITPFMIVGILCILFLASVSIAFFYTLASSELAGVILLFLSATGMIFVSGGFLPAAFLPVIFQKIAAFLPVSVMMELMETLFTGEIQGILFLKAAIFITVILALTSGSISLKQKIRPS